MSAGLASLVCLGLRATISQALYEHTCQTQEVHSLCACIDVHVCLQMYTCVHACGVERAASCVLFLWLLPPVLRQWLGAHQVIQSSCLVRCTGLPVLTHSESMAGFVLFCFNVWALGIELWFLGL